ncbi:hypothetical protein DdX_22219 [Ditylenchus destructor]|uniref:F-box domain-containing protein n=1 Tax=Ditylenchus destructor TaxID=166010 RepID=A0AAD4MG31_9BILA|nr:hypothetical protein DdX_22219 [Ditylenchus destructor]
METNINMEFFSLPPEIITQIARFLPYYEVAKFRLTSSIFAALTSPSLEAMQECVLEVRAYHREDRITYGSLKNWGEKWNYADVSDNSIFYRYHEDDLFSIRFRLTDDFVQVWVNSRMMAIYPYKTTINSYKEITSVWVRKFVTKTSGAAGEVCLILVDDCKFFMVDTTWVLKTQVHPAKTDRIGF